MLNSLPYYLIFFCGNEILYDKIYQLSLPAQKFKSWPFFGPKTTFFVHLKPIETNLILYDSCKLNCRNLKLQVFITF